MSDYPEHEKLHKISDQSQAIGEFLDWLEDEKNVYLGYTHIIDTPWSDEERFDLWHYNTQKLLAEFFDIDYDKLQAEKDIMLEVQRRLNDG